MIDFEYITGKSVGDRQWKGLESSAVGTNGWAQAEMLKR